VCDKNTTITTKIIRKHLPIELQNLRIMLNRNIKGRCVSPKEMWASVWRECANA